MVFMALENKNNGWDILLQKSILKKTRRVTAWCLRFCRNASLKKEEKSLKLGPLKTEELADADSYWIRREQEVVNLNSKEAQQLGLTRCNDDII